MTDVVDDFLTADTARRLELVGEGANEKALIAHLGDDQWAEYQKLAQRVDAKHLALTVPPNLVFVPGIMGSLLQSETKGGVWWIDGRTRHHIDDLGLSPDGASDRNPDDQIVPGNVDTTYEAFLTATLARSDFGHRTFPFDWRKLPTRSADLLAERIDDLHANNGNKPVNLVGHSMGGLMIRAALTEQGDRLWPKIGRIVFVGTPHFGAPAIAGYLKNHFWGFEMIALLGLFLSPATFRSLWGALAMLPAPRGIYPGTREKDPDPWKGKGSDAYSHPCANFDLYDAAAWHLDLKSGEQQDLQGVLNGAREFHERMYEGHLRLTNDQRQRMAVIAGVGQKTLFRLAYRKRFLGLWEKTEKVTKTIDDDRHREGDGRVPVASAALDHVLVRYVKGVHGGLVNIPAVYNAVFDFLSGNDMSLPASPKAARSSHLAPGVHATETPALDGTAVTANTDIWKLESDPAALAELKARLEGGQLPEFDRVKLL
jgi:pimeloyl-ACP methyl ester carboxylesterase